jgi:hypothetical protein
MQIHVMNIYSVNIPLSVLCLLNVAFRKLELFFHLQVKGEQCSLPTEVRLKELASLNCIFPLILKIRNVRAAPLEHAVLKTGNIRDRN